MTLTDRLAALATLGERLQNLDTEPLNAVIRRTALHNSWLTEANQRSAIGTIRDAFLQNKKLEKWVSAYNFPPSGGLRGEITEGSSKRIALILAGNIPLVGFHDVLCVFVSGHRAKVKLSDKDPFLLPFLLKMLNEINPRTAAYFETTDGRLTDFDAVIATGSNNSARYFDAYFGKYPHIIRRNRNAVGILRGDETTADFEKLADDVFLYFGLGCRNVSKLFVPKGYDFEPLLTVFHERNALVLHDKYKNNFDYNFTLLILNKVKYQSNGCILLHESEQIASPIAVLFYEFYDDFDVLETQLQARKEDIQLAVSKQNVANLPTFDFGEAQKPSLSDYADGIDTLQFLIELA